MPLIKHSKPSIFARDIARVVRQLQRGCLAGGVEVRKLERFFSARVKRPAVLCQSGTAALHLALLALDMNHGSRIAIPTHACPSVLYAVRYIRAEPVLFDSGNLGLGLNPGSFHTALKQSHGAVVVHSFGYPVPAGHLTGIQIPWIEDCAQALGASIGNRPAGALGTLAAFSFYPTKMIAGIEGGALAGDSHLILKVRDLLSTHHADDALTRYPYEMNDICAVLVRSQLRRLKRFIEIRRNIAAFYVENLQDLPVELPPIHADTEPAFYRFCIRTSVKRDILIKKARRQGIAFGYGVKTPLHRMLDLNPTDFPNSEDAFRYCISLPIYPGLKLADLGRVVDFLRKSLTAKT